MLGSLIKGVVKREAKVMGANKLLGRGKKALSNRKQNVEQRRETARNMMSGRERQEEEHLLFNQVHP